MGVQRLSSGVQTLVSTMPHFESASHSPQLMMSPQPSATVPQSMPRSSHDFGSHCEVPPTVTTDPPLPLLPRPPLPVVLPVPLFPPRSGVSSGEVPLSM